MPLNDGVIDFRLKEDRSQIRNLLHVRSTLHDPCPIVA